MHDDQEQTANCSISAEYEVEVIFKSQLITSTYPFYLLYEEFGKVVNFFFSQNILCLAKMQLQHAAASWSNYFISYSEF